MAQELQLNRYMNQPEYADLKALMIDMTRSDPAKRPTMEEALARLYKIRKQINPKAYIPPTIKEIEQKIEEIEQEINIELKNIAEKKQMILPKGVLDIYNNKLKALEMSAKKMPKKDREKVKEEIARLRNIVRDKITTLKDATTISDEKLEFERIESNIREALNALEKMDKNLAVNASKRLNELNTRDPSKRSKVLLSFIEEDANKKIIKNFAFGKSVYNKMRISLMSEEEKAEDNIKKTLKSLKSIDAGVSEKALERLKSLEKANALERSKALLSFINEAENKKIIKQAKNGKILFKKLNKNLAIEKKASAKKDASVTSTTSESIRVNDKIEANIIMAINALRSSSEDLATEALDVLEKHKNDDPIVKSKALSSFIKMNAETIKALPKVGEIDVYDTITKILKENKQIKAKQIEKKEGVAQVRDFKKQRADLDLYVKFKGILNNFNEFFEKSMPSKVHFRVRPVLDMYRVQIKNEIESVFKNIDGNKVDEESFKSIIARISAAMKHTAVKENKPTFEYLGIIKKQLEDLRDSLKDEPVGQRKSVQASPPEDRKSRASIERSKVALTPPVPASPVPVAPDKQEVQERRASAPQTSITSAPATAKRPSSIEREIAPPSPLKQFQALNAVRQEFEPQIILPSEKQKQPAPPAFVIAPTRGHKEPPSHNMHLEFEITNLKFDANKVGGLIADLERLHQKSMVQIKDNKVYVYGTSDQIAQISSQLANSSLKPINPKIVCKDDKSEPIKDSLDVLNKLKGINEKSLGPKVEVNKIQIAERTLLTDVFVQKYQKPEAAQKRPSR